MAAIPSIQVVAGCDIDPTAQARFVDRWSARWPGIHIYADYREMLAQESPHLVSIATPDHLHMEPVLEAVAAGARMIFCEKPMATSLSDAHRMLEATRRRGVTMTVNFTRRWTPEFVEARRLLRAGSVGQLSQIVVQHGGPRAMLFRNHGHLLDALNYFAESEPVWVVAELEPELARYGTTYHGDGGYDPSTEPGVNCYIAFRNGVRAYLTGMKDCVDELRVDLIGNLARLTLDLEGMRLVTIDSPNSRFKPPISHIEFRRPRWSVSGIEAAMRDLIDSHEAGRPTASPPESALLTIALTDAILHSQAAGNTPVHLRSAFQTRDGAKPGLRRPH